MLNILSPTQTRRTQPCDYTANNNPQQTLLHRQTQNANTKTQRQKQILMGMLNILSVPTQTRRTQPCDYTANNNPQQTLLH